MGYVQGNHERGIAVIKGVMPGIRYKEERVGGGAAFPKTKLLWRIQVVLLEEKRQLLPGDPLKYFADDVEE